MKNSNPKLVLCVFLALFVFLTFTNRVYAQIFPDEGVFDTTGLIQETLTDGLDTIWYWGIDETTKEINLRTTGTYNYHNSSDYSQYAKVHADSTIYINLGSNQKTINQGLYGFHIAGIYGRKVIPNDGSATDQWQWMSELAPSSLRFQEELIANLCIY